MWPVINLSVCHCLFSILSISPSFHLSFSLYPYICVSLLSLILSLSHLSEVFKNTEQNDIHRNLFLLFPQANYKQSRAYAVKYGAALSRALGMVRSHVRLTLENLTAQAGEQVNIDFLLPIDHLPPFICINWVHGQNAFNRMNPGPCFQL